MRLTSLTVDGRLARLWPCKREAVEPRSGSVANPCSQGSRHWRYPSAEAAHAHLRRADPRHSRDKIHRIEQLPNDLERAVAGLTDASESPQSMMAVSDVSFTDDGGHLLLSLRERERL